MGDLSRHTLRDLIYTRDLVGDLLDHTPGIIQTLISDPPHRPRHRRPRT